MIAPRINPPHIRAAALAAYGVKSASAIGAELGLSKAAVKGIWARAREFGEVEPKFKAASDGLSDVDLKTLSALTRSGRKGLPKPDIMTLLGSNSEHAVASFKKRAATHGIAISAFKIGRVDRIGVFHYALRDLPPEPPSETSGLAREFGIIPVSRDGVSVAYLSCLDGARAGDGCGEQA